MKLRTTKKRSAIRYTGRYLKTKPIYSRDLMGLIYYHQQKWVLDVFYWGYILKSFPFQLKKDAVVKLETCKASDFQDAIDYLNGFGIFDTDN